MSVKLTDAQLAMLKAAAQREDLCLTAPDKMKGAILTKVSAKLVKLGLVRVVRAKAGMPVWRRDDAGQSSALKLTAAALKAIDIDAQSEESTKTSKTTRPQPQPSSDATTALDPDIVGEHAKTLTPRAGSKLARVIDLLRRSEGATILHLMEATGWLPHTTRAALTGLRKRGYAVVRGRINGGDSIYRIAGPAPDHGDRTVVEPQAPADDERELKPEANQAA
jgi:Protein of unknown function (DUF3489)